MAASLDRGPLLDLFRHERSFVLTTHVSSDGDGLGSELALGRALTRLGKSVRIINPTATTPRYAFLSREGEIETYGPEHDAVLRSTGAIVVLDINRWSRLGAMAEGARSSPARKACVDHHPAPEIGGAASLVDPSAAATGVLVLELLEELTGDIPPDAIDPLYVALMTDTGSFRFGNTDARTLRLAARLVALGAAPDRLYEAVYETSTPGRLRLLGEVLSSLTYELDGRLVHYSIGRMLLARTGATLEDVEGFTDIVRSAEKSEVVVSFLEAEDGGTKVSLRSKGGRVDVGAIAAAFGGGGHAAASGILRTDSLEIVREIVLEAVRAAVREPGTP